MSDGGFDDPQDWDLFLDLTKDLEFEILEVVPNGNYEYISRGNGVFLEGAVNLKGKWKPNRKWIDNYKTFYQMYPDCIFEPWEDDPDWGLADQYFFLEEVNFSIKLSSKYRKLNKDYYSFITRTGFYGILK